MLTRKYIDCREFPSDTPCTLRIEGTEDEVLDIAVAHAVERHGHHDSTELRMTLRSLLKDMSLITVSH